MYGALLNGGRLIVPPLDRVRDINLFLSLIKRHRVTILNQTPQAFYALADAEKKSREHSLNQHLRTIIFGGDKLLPGNLSAWSRWYSPADIQLVNMYGITETTVHVTHYPLKKPDIRSPHGISPIGEPLPETTLYILDNHLNLVPVGISGEIFVGGTGVARGYLNRVELTARRFLENPHLPGEIIYKSGDLGRRLPGGSVEYLGRNDDQVQIRGFRIEPAEIENSILKHPAVKETVVIAREDKHRQTFLCAYLRLKPGESLPGIRDYLSGMLPQYMVPAYIVPVKTIPLTPNGKLDKAALPDPKTGEDKKNRIPPRNHLEETLAGIWAEVLEIKKETTGIDDNFFHLGGHSLKATLMIAKIHKELHVRMPLLEVFTTPSIRGMAGYIKKTAGDKYTAVAAAEKKEYHRLSSAQKRLYVLQRMEVEGTGYNMPRVIPLHMEIDVKQLDDTFKKMIRRHESLRTSFEIIDDEPVQKVHEPGALDFKVDYFQMSEKQALQKVNHFVTPFDLSQAPLIRVVLIKVGDKKYLLLLDLHHIITDGMSQEILEREFMQLHGGEALPPLSLQYKDYAQWQNSDKVKESITGQEAHWLKEFAGEIPVLNLPGDYARPAIQSFEGGAAGFELSRPETSSLNQIALDNNSTLFMVLLALYNIFLAKMSGQEEIIIGTPIAGRRHADLEKIIGMFVNTLAIKNYPNSEKTFTQFLKELRTKTLEAFENQEYQFEDLVEKVTVNRDTSRNPLFDVMFVLRNIREEAGAAGEERESPAPGDQQFQYEHRIAKFDLTLIGAESGGRLAFSFEYCGKLFKRETIERFIAYFKKIAAAVIKEPGKRISDLEIILEEERKQVLFEFNNTQAQYPLDKTLHQLFARQVEQTPDNISVTGAGGPGTGTPHLTYKELDEKSHQLAYLLRARGVKPDSIAAIMVERSINMMIAILGILKAGGAYLPIEPGYPPERLDYMLADSGTKVLVTTRGLSQKTAFEKDIVYFDDYQGLPSSTQHQLTSRRQPAASLAYVIYTSGSTGKPKGVLVEHAPVVNLVFSQKRQFKIDADDRILQFSSVCFDASVEQIFIALFSGAVLALIDESTLLDNSKFRSFISKRSITHIHAVPSFLNNIELKEKQGYHLRRIISGGDVCPVSLANKLSRYCDFYNEYGPTETTVTSIEIMMGYDEVDESLHRLPIGRPIDNTTVYILDNWLKSVGVGVVGELYIGGAGVTRGYLNRPGLTFERFINYKLQNTNYNVQNYKNNSIHAFMQPCNHATMQSPHYPIYRTGDLARWLPDGNIEYLGRIDHQVKIRGYRIELGEIEHQLLKHEAIKEAVVVAKNNESNDQHLCTYIVADRESQLTGAELTEFLSKTLPGYMIPPYFVFLEHIPLTPAPGQGPISHPRMPLKKHWSGYGPRYWH
jgi:amino acid adenylation domain-containing protein